MGKSFSDRFVVLVNDALERIEQIPPDELQEKMDKEVDFELLDIRNREEWENARIINAGHLSRGILERDIEERVSDLDKEIVLYSNSGYLSALSADNLQKMGYKNVRSLKGGFHSWMEAGYPIEKDEL